MSVIEEVSCVSRPKDKIMTFLIGPSHVPGDVTEVLRLGFDTRCAAHSTSRCLEIGCGPLSMSFVLRKCGGEDTPPMQYSVGIDVLDDSGKGTKFPGPRSSGWAKRGSRCPFEGFRITLIHRVELAKELKALSWIVRCGRCKNQRSCWWTRESGCMGSSDV